MAVEPIPGEPAGLVDCGGDRALVVADYHAGIEAGLRREGVELDSDADGRLAALTSLLARTGPDRLVVLGDLGHAIGEPGRAEREEIESVLSTAAERVPVTVVRGNHDSGIETPLGNADNVSLGAGRGVRRGEVGFAHGHTWPDPSVLAADVLCVGHEHPVVGLEDEVGGGRVERVWLRGGVDPEPFRTHHGESVAVPERLVVFPAFNDRSGGTRVNVPGREFLSPFLPGALRDGQAYLLDGTRLGDYEHV
jgi:putative SbcD/Mre11-related phosphoesterase